MTLPNELRTARFLAVHKWPYLGAAIWRMIPVHKVIAPQGVATMACDKYWRWYWSEEAIARARPERLPTWIAHEAWHLIRGHPWRMSAYDPVIANLAGDIELNGPLGADGGDVSDLIVPATFGFPEKLAAEEYAELLQKSAKTVQIPMCGSCAHGGTDPWEEPGDADGAVGPSEAQMIRKQVAEAVRQAAKSRGNMPGGMVEWAEEVLAPPTVPWQQVLRARIRNAVDIARGKVDYSYRRPSRRPRAPLLLPSLVAPEVCAAIIADQSGSMSGALAEIRSESEGIIKALGGRVTYIGCDTEVTQQKRVRSMREVKEYKGWGGTDLRPGFEAACALRPRVGVLVVITDSWTPWPDVAPPMPCVVCVASHGTEDGVPEWARVVRCGSERG